MSCQPFQLPVASSSSSSTRPTIFSDSRRLRGGNSVLLSRNAVPNLSLNLPRHRRPPIPVVRAFGEEAEALITDGDGRNAATATSVDEQEPEPTPEDLEYVGQIKRVLELLRKNRDMLFGEVKLTIMIEDPREVERRRLLGIDDSDAPSREDLVEALEEVNEGKIPRNRVALRMLAEEMISWPNLETEAPKTKSKSKSLYAKTTDIGIDPEVAAKRLNIDWDSAAEIEDAESADEADVPAAVGYGALYLVTAFPVIIAAGGFILRDWSGKLLKTGTTYYGTTTILVAEARALRDGLSAAIQAGYHNLIVEGDNKIVIQALEGKIQIPW